MKRTEDEQRRGHKEERGDFANLSTVLSDEESSAARGSTVDKLLTRLCFLFLKCKLELIIESHNIVRSPWADHIKIIRTASGE